MVGNGWRWKARGGWLEKNLEELTFYPGGQGYTIFSSHTPHPLLCYELVSLYVILILS